jgi:beta-lactamase class A
LIPAAPRAGRFLVLLGIAAGCRTSGPGPAERIEGLFRESGGRWGLYFRDLNTGEELDYHSERVFHAASTMKLLVLIKVFRDVEDGRYRLEYAVPVADVFPSAVRGDFRTAPEAPEVRDAMGKTLTVSELVRWMIVRSDNLATNLLIRQAGGPEAISEHARRYGMEKTAVARYIEDQAAFDAGLSSRAQPHEMGRLLEKLWRREVVSPSASEKMLEVLASTGPEWLGLLLPPGTRVAHKTGAIEGVRHDVGIVNVAPGRAFVLCVMADGLADEKAGEEVISQVCRHFFEYWIEGPSGKAGIRPTAIYCARSFRHPAMAETLVSLLDEKETVSDRLRTCDRAAESLAALLDVPEMFNDEAPQEARDSAIRRLEAWWAANGKSLDWAKLRSRR